MRRARYWKGAVADPLARALAQQRELEAKSPQAAEEAKRLEQQIAASLEAAKAGVRPPAAGETRVLLPKGVPREEGERAVSLLTRPDSPLVVLNRVRQEQAQQQVKERVRTRPQPEPPEYTSLVKALGAQFKHGATPGILKKRAFPEGEPVERLSRELLQKPGVPAAMGAAEAAGTLVKELVYMYTLAGPTRMAMKLAGYPVRVAGRALERAVREVPAARPVLEAFQQAVRKGRYEYVTPSLLHRINARLSGRTLQAGEQVLEYKPSLAQAAAALAKTTAQGAVGGVAFGAMREPLEGQASQLPKTLPHYAMAGAALGFGIPLLGHFVGARLRLPSTSMALAAQERFPNLASDNPYEVLGLDPRATPSQVKRVWRALSRQWHPDAVRGRGGTDQDVAVAQQVFQRLADAHRAILQRLEILKELGLEPTATKADIAQKLGLQPDATDAQINEALANFLRARQRTPRPPAAQTAGAQAAGAAQATQQAPPQAAPQTTPQAPPQAAPQAPPQPAPQPPPQPAAPSPGAAGAAGVTGATGAEPTAPPGPRMEPLPRRRQGEPPTDELTPELQEWLDRQKTFIAAERAAGRSADELTQLARDYEDLLTEAQLHDDVTRPQAWKIMDEIQAALTGTPAAPAAAAAPGAPAAQPARPTEGAAEVRPPEQRAAPTIQAPEAQAAAEPTARPETARQPAPEPAPEPTTAEGEELTPTLRQWVEEEKDLIRRERAAGRPVEERMEQYMKSVDRAFVDGLITLQQAGRILQELEAAARETPTPRTPTGAAPTGAAPTAPAPPAPRPAVPQAEPAGPQPTPETAPEPAEETAPTTPTVAGVSRETVASVLPPKIPVSVPLAPVGERRAFMKDFRARLRGSLRTGAPAAELLADLDIAHRQGKVSTAEYRRLKAEAEGRPDRYADKSDEDLLARAWEVLNRINEMEEVAARGIKQWTRRTDSGEVVSGTSITNEAGRALGRIKDDHRILNEIEQELVSRGLNLWELLDALHREARKGREAPPEDIEAEIERSAIQAEARMPTARPRPQPVAPTPRTEPETAPAAPTRAQAEAVPPSQPIAGPTAAPTTRAEAATAAAVEADLAGRRPEAQLSVPPAAEPQVSAETLRRPETIRTEGATRELAETVPGVPTEQPTEPVPRAAQERGAGTAPGRPGEGRRGDVPEHRPAGPEGAPAGLEGDEGAVAGGREERGEGGRPGGPDLGTERRRGDEAAGAGGPERRGLLPRNYHLEDPSELGVDRSELQKLRDNVEAIRLLKQLEAEDRPATPAEQRVLIKYSGWGWAPQVFSYAPPRDIKVISNQLRELLTDSELESAERSTPNAHYTSPEVITAMWNIVQRLGYEGHGRILEPAMGVGYILAMAPQKIAASSRFTGVELDLLSGRIAKKLFPESDIRVEGFEAVRTPNDFYDVVITNVPFGDYEVFDPKYKHLKFSIHNYFLAKSVDLVRPGGIVVAVTTRYTMDSKAAAHREYIAQRADLVGAIRLPRTAFERVAGTQVTTDILILRKRAPDEAPSAESWTKTETVWLRSTQGDRDMPVEVNEYFVRHPEMILGQMQLVRGMYRNNEAAVLPREGRLGDHLAEAIARLPANIVTPVRPKVPVEPRPENLAVPPDAREGALVIVKGQPYVRRGDQLVAVDRFDGKALTGSTLERVKMLVALRDAAYRVLDTQLQDRPLNEIRAAQQALNNLYDRFVARYGPINKTVGTRHVNLEGFRDDPGAPLVAALETVSDDGETITKASIFTERLITPRKPVEKAASVEDAMHIVLNEEGRLNVDRMARLTGLPREQVIRELAGKAFEDPETRELVDADTYLSGNVRTKLAIAREAAKVDPKYRANVEALEKVQPEDVPPEQIEVSLGQSWIPADVVRQFVADLLNDGSTTGISVTHIPELAIWRLSVADYIASRPTSVEEWGHPLAPAPTLIEAALQQRPVTVYVTDVDGRTVPDPQATLEAREKLQRIQERFASWVWENTDRAARLHRIYNDTVNDLRPFHTDGSYLTLPGMARVLGGEPIQVRPYQLNAIARILRTGNTLIDAPTGSGKTLMMIAAGMEAKRIGLARKLLYVVPNPVLQQFAREFMQLYPTARVLIATKEDLSKERRRAFVAKATTGNWDAIIMTHTTFAKIPVSPEFEAALLREEINSIREVLARVEGVDPTGRTARRAHSRSVKQIQKILQDLHARLQELSARERKEETVHFEELGADMLFVDEAHYYKNLYAFSASGRGFPASQRAMDMYLKTTYLNRLTKNRGVVFATATPVSNTLVELFTMLRYLAPQRLAERHMRHLDAWAATFAAPTTKLERSPEGGFRVHTRAFARFRNVVPELSNLYRSVAEVVKEEDIAHLLNRPQIEGGQPEVVAAPMSPELRAYQQTLADRAQAVRKGAVRPHEDNMLKISTDGRKAALDIRLVMAGAPDRPDSKVNIAAERIYRIWQETAKQRGTQLVFSDLSAPSDRFNIYEDLRDKLIAKGIPPEEIRFVHEAKNDAQRERLFDAVRKGKVRILFGSTDKMGTGTNVQKRIVAMHHLDAPFRPSDLVQRNGRGWRTGNDNKSVKILIYVTEGSFDAYMWQLLDMKQKFIDQFRSGDIGVRSIEDVEGRELTPAEVMAIATGNPLVMEKARIDNEVIRLSRLRAGYLSRLGRMKQELAAMGPQREALEQTLAEVRKEVAQLQDTRGDKFVLRIGQVAYTKRPEAGAALQSRLLLLPSEGEPEVIGSFAGLDLRAHYYLGGFDVWLGQHARARMGIGTTPQGAIQMLEHLASRLPNVINEYENAIAELDRRRAELERLVQEPFAHEAQLNELLARQAEINRALELNQDPGDLAVGLEEAEPGERPAGDEGPSYIAEVGPLYHGSPYVFARFDISRVGTGEGAQAYGYGLYFASKREVAEWYRQQLVADHPHAITIDGVDLMDFQSRPGQPWWVTKAPYQDYFSDPSERRAYLELWYMAASYDPALGKGILSRIRERVKEQLKRIEEGDVFPDVDRWVVKALDEFLEKYWDRLDYVPPKRGALYEVVLKPDHSEFLDWDAPLQDQSPIVRKALDRLGVQLPQDQPGRQAYQLLSQKLGGRKQASEALLRAGVRGIRYLDAVSRKQGTGTHNYVVFDDRDIVIRGVSEHAEHTFGSRKDAEEAARLGMDADSVPDAQPWRRPLPPAPRTFVDIVGKRVASATDVALLLRPFRSPKAETAHFIFVDDEGNVLGHRADTSGAINYVAWDTSMARLSWELAHQAKRLGATQVWFVHNHTSGRTRPSEDDYLAVANVATRLAEHNLRVRFAIINHGEVTEIILKLDANRLRTAIERRVRDDLELLGSAVNPQVVRTVAVRWAARSLLEGGYVFPETYRFTPPPADTPDWTEWKRPLIGPVDAAKLAGRPPAKTVHVLYRSMRGDAIALVPHRYEAALHPERWLEAEAKSVGAYDAVFVTDLGDGDAFIALVDAARRYEGKVPIQDVVGIPASGRVAEVVSAGAYGYQPAEPRRHRPRLARRIAEEPPEYGAQGPAPQPQGQQPRGQEPQGEESQGQAPQTQELEPYPTERREVAVKIGARDVTLRPISPVEVAAMAEELLGERGEIFLRRYRTALGMFYPGIPLRIGLHPALGKDYQLFAQVLAHEVGHLVDYLPQRTLQRGNILGRIASLRDYLKHTIDAQPTEPSKALTPKDRRRLRQQAIRAVGPRPPKDEEADLAAWAKRVAEEYKALLEEEMDARGLIGQERVREELIALSQWWSPYRWYHPLSETRKAYLESSRELYADAVSVLLNSPGSLAERAPTFFQAFVNYLERKPEVQQVYQEIQDLLTNEEELMEARRRALEADFALEEAIREAARQREQRQPFAQYVRQLLLRRYEPVVQAERQMLKARGETPPPWSEEWAAKMAMQEFNHGDNVNRLLLINVIREVYKPMLEAGIDENQAGRYLLLRRIAEGDRGGIAEAAKQDIMDLTGETSWPAAREKYKAMAEQDPQLDPGLLEIAESGVLNPHGYTPEEAARTLRAMVDELGPERYAKLEQLMARLLDILGKATDDAVELGVISRELYEQKILPNRRTYVPFIVLHYFTGRVPAGIRRQIGTLKGVGNPYRMAILKAMALNRLNEYQRAKLAILSVADQFPDVGPERPVDRYHPLGQPEPGKEFLLYHRDGKLYAREVPIYVARLLERMDIGSLARLTAAISNSSYRFFHPLFVTWNLRWLVRNVVRDPKRAYRTALAAAHGGKPTYRQVIEAFLDLVRLPASYLETAPAAWRAARQQYDKLIEQMLADRALGRTFHSFDPNPEADLVVQLAQQAGLISPAPPEPLSHRLREARGTGGIRGAARVAAEVARRLWEKLRIALSPLERFGTFQEIWTKAAMYRLLGRLKIGNRTRAYIVRNYTGTPDATDAGLASDVVNGFYFYANVISAGWRADLEVATHPQSAFGFWLRSVIIDYWWKALMAAGALGWLGQEIKEWWDHVPSYDKEKYLILPLPPFYVTTPEGRKLAVYARIPLDDFDRVLAAAVWAYLVNKAPYAPSRAADIIAGEFPGFNPGLQMVNLWIKMARGRRPEDPYFNRPLIPEAEWTAGGWYRAREMLRYSLGELGVVADVTQWAGRATATLTEEDLPAPERARRTLELLPGLSAIVKFSDAGLAETQRDELAAERQQRARLVADLDPEVRRLVAERQRLNALGTERLTRDQELRRRQLNAWYRSYYLPLTSEMELRRETDDREGYNRAKTLLTESAKNISNIARPPRQQRQQRQPREGALR